MPKQNKKMKKQLFRNRTNKMLGGVAQGLAEYFEIDATIVRVALVAAFFTPIPVVIPYIVLWVVMPVKENQVTIIN
jgi:phage shock protein C